MATELIGDGTAAGPVEFLDTIVEKGRATPGAIKPLKISFIKVLEVVGGNQWKSVVISDIDLDEYMNVFSTKTIGTYAPKSISVYRSRVHRVVGWYEKFLKDKGWMPMIKARLPQADKPAATTSTAADDLPTRTLYAVPSVSSGLTYPFPLENGEVAQIAIPRGLTASDATRLAGFIKTLVLESGTE